MAKSESLKAELRPRLGSRHARKLRADGRIPAVLEPDGTSPHLDIAIDRMAFLATRRHHTHLYDIEVGGKMETAIVHDLAWDVFGDEIIHIEFKRVRRDVKTEIEVELEFRGHPKGGMLNHLVTHVTVRCFPDQIPDEIEVPVGHLDTGGAVTAKELVMPAGVELVKPTGDFKIAVVVLAKMDIPEAGAEAAPDAAAAVSATPGAAAPAAAAPGAKPAAGAKAAAPAKEEKPKKG